MKIHKEKFLRKVSFYGILAQEIPVMTGAFCSTRSSSPHRVLQTGVCADL